MPKTAAKAPKTPHQESLETASSSPAPPPKKKKQRTAGQPYDLSEFGTPHRGATHWGLRRHLPDGSMKRLAAKSDNGTIVVHEWPFEELGVDTIMRRWGEGSYRLEWIGPGAKGQRTHLSWGRDFAVQLPASSPPPTEPAERPASPAGLSDDPMVRAFQLLDVIDRRANAAADRDRAFLQAVMTTARGDSETTGVVRELAGVVRELRAEVADLRGRVDDEEEEDEEDEDEEEEGGDDGRIFRPGEPKGDAAVTATLNKLAELLDGVSPAAGSVVSEWLTDRAAEMAQRRAARLGQGTPSETNGAASSEPVG